MHNYVPKDSEITRNRLTNTRHLKKIQKSYTLPESIYLNQNYNQDSIYSKCDAGFPREIKLNYLPKL